MKSPLPGLSLAEMLEWTIELSWTAAAMLKSYYRSDGSDLNVRDKAEGPVTVADEAVNEYILGRIQGLCGKFCGYLTEETYQSGDGAVPDKWVWIIDPLDGTRDFIDKTGEYAIHIALTYQQRPMLAVVVVPESDKLYAAVRDEGCFRMTADGARETVMVAKNRQLADLVVVASRNHRSEKLVELLNKLPCQQQKEVGSIGCKIAAIVDRQADVYVSLSGKSAPKDWDFAAPELILTEAGGQFTYQDGSPILYNRGDASQWGCAIASNAQWHEQLLAYCQ